MTGVQVTGIDHIVLHCADVETTLAWYRDVLGLAPVRVEEWRAGSSPFPSVRVSADTLIDLLPGDPTDGRLDHFCVVVEPTDLVEFAAARGLEIVDGPGIRFGARGDGTSIYVHDPDGALVEVRWYETSSRHV